MDNTKFQAIVEYSCEESESLCLGYLISNPSMLIAARNTHENVGMRGMYWRKGPARGHWIPNSS